MPYSGPSRQSFGEKYGLTAKNGGTSVMSRRIAVAMNFLPVPADSGAPIRAYRLTRALTELGPVTLYCRTSAALAAQHEHDEALRCCARVRMHTRSKEEYATYFRTYAEDSIRQWMAPTDLLGDRLREDHAREPFDVLVCEQLFTANLAQACPGLPCVLDEHNVESQALTAILASQRPGSAGSGSASVAEVDRYEKAVWRSMQRIVCVSTADADAIGAHTPVPIDVIPNGVAVDELPFTSPSRRTTRDVLFVGAFFWPPNVRAARFLATEVMPRVWAEEPAARLVLCGRSPPAEVVFLQRRRVEVTGTVPSVQPSLARAAVFANALFDGAGTSLKVLEALASGIPLISTSKGLRGYPAEVQGLATVAETAEDFAGAILTVFRDPAAFDRPARAGREFAEQRSWERVGARFAALVADTVRVARPS